MSVIDKAAFAHQILEFADVCNALDASELGNWSSVSVHRRNNDTFLRIYVDRRQIPLDSRTVYDDEELKEDNDAEGDGVDIHEASDAALLHRRCDAEVNKVQHIVYDVVYSQSYQVPVLYFMTDDMSGRPQLDLEWIQQYLIAPDMEDAMKQIGNMGAISIANHPVTDVPNYFIHPCQTADAMSSLDIEAGELDYLMAWLGLIGSSVALHVPLEVAQAIAAKSRQGASQ